MSKVITIKGNLFEAPKGSILIHACNTKGSWGAGIAKQFAKKFPKAYNTYNLTCKQWGSSLLGTCLLIPAGDYTIACLFTSKGYGVNTDRIDSILEATEKALSHLISQNINNAPMCTCKINSGLFGVPWPKTKAIFKATDKEFTVYDYE